MPEEFTILKKEQRHDIEHESSIHAKNINPLSEIYDSLLKAQLSHDLKQFVAWLENNITGCEEGYLRQSCLQDDKLKELRKQAGLDK